jgi:hypothetical protein
MNFGVEIAVVVDRFRITPVTKEHEPPIVALLFQIPLEHPAKMSLMQQRKNGEHR